MPYLPVYVRVGQVSEAWLGDLEVEDFERATVEGALPPFLHRVAGEVSGIALDQEG